MCRYWFLSKNGNQSWYALPAKTRLLGEILQIFLIEVSVRIVQRITLGFFSAFPLHHYYGALKRGFHRLNPWLSLYSSNKKKGESQPELPWAKKRCMLITLICYLGSSGIVVRQCSAVIYNTFISGSRTRLSVKPSK